MIYSNQLKMEKGSDKMRGFRNMRGQIKTYRASGRMFAQTVHTGTNWGAGYRPNPIECNQCGNAIPCIVEWYSDPCKHGKTHNSILMNEKEVI